MKHLLTTTYGQHNLSVMIESNKENYAFPTYFIDGYEVKDISNSLPIFAMLLIALQQDYLDRNNLKLASVIDLRKR